MPIDPLTNTQDLARTLSNSTTTDQVWNLLSRWRGKTTDAVRVAASAIQVWDMGLVRMVVIEYHFIEEAMANPSWPQWASDVVGQWALQGLIEARSKAALVPLCQVLWCLTRARAVRADGPLADSAIQALNGGSVMTHRQMRAATLLLGAVGLTSEQYDHIYTCARRANVLGGHPLLKGLLAHPLATVDHWRIALEESGFGVIALAGQMVERADILGYDDIRELVASDLSDLHPARSNEGDTVQMLTRFAAAPGSPTFDEAVRSTIERGRPLNLASLVDRKPALAVFLSEDTRRLLSDLLRPGPGRIVT